MLTSVNSMQHKARFWKQLTFKDHLLHVNISTTVTPIHTEIGKFIENRDIHDLLNCNCAKLAIF